LAERLQYPFGGIINPAWQGVPAAGLDGVASPGGTVAGGDGALPGPEGPAPTSGGPQAVGGEPGSASGGSARAPAQTGGGRSLSRSGGGDPTAVAQAQEAGNLHLGKVPLNAYYDFDNAGFHLAPKDEEFSL